MWIEVYGVQPNKPLIGTPQPKQCDNQFVFKNHVYLEPGKRGRSEKSSAIMAPIAHMSENMIGNEHINKNGTDSIRLSGKATNILNLPTAAL